MLAVVHGPAGLNDAPGRDAVALVEVGGRLAYISVSSATLLGNRHQQSSAARQGGLPSTQCGQVLLTAGADPAVRSSAAAGAGALQLAALGGQASPPRSFHPSSYQVAP